MSFMKDEPVLVMIAAFTIGFVTVAIVIGVTGTIKNGQEHTRLMQQCLADGHKEYECVSMLRGMSGDTYTPVIVTVTPRR